MSAQLPYLPPLKPKSPLQAVAEGTAADVRSTPGAGPKVATLLRGALASVPAASMTIPAAAANVVQEQAASKQLALSDALHETGAFVNTLFGGPQAYPSSRPDTTTARAAPATSAQVTVPGAMAAPATGATAALPALAEAPEITAPAKTAAEMVKPGTPVFTNPIAAGVKQQTDYAEAQRKAVLQAANIASMSGNSGNASLRYMAALHALPALSGQNAFANVGANYQADMARTAQQDVASQRLAETHKYETDVKAKEVRRNAQPTVIGEEINPDPVSRVFAPVIKKYGFIDRDEATGKTVVRDMQGTILKPPTAAAPVTRSEFITKNKQANPGMSEADIGREYDRKYGGKN